ncbi:YfiT family bacillithiol transferase [Deinococcus hopiensis]|uniref:DinB superfamily protein n=1 Tax=Deinococcus hopiensis KR-140 TaxID=695939 RepID=A0A1W1VPD2_9DEIO|nr:putative metal-dependent hydrolase [Deinococcus hopiensis]SMB95232.1 DinB superfamily protein [Deinococcus hopiensis KR-140]
MTQAHRTEDRRYPIGPVPTPLTLTPEEREEAISALRLLPSDLRVVSETLTGLELDTPYREGGWTGRQVVHHVADSHINAYARVKLALTEDNPVVKPYEEGLWAGLPDSALPTHVSLTLLEGLHARLVALLEALPEDAWARTWTHPGLGRTFTLDTLLAMYAWHGRHHTAHMRLIKM